MKRSSRCIGSEVSARLVITSPCWLQGNVSLMVERAPRVVRAAGPPFLNGCRVARAEIGASDAMKSPTAAVASVFAHPLPVVVAGTCALHKIPALRRRSISLWRRARRFSMAGGGKTGARKITEARGRLEKSGRNGTPNGLFIAASPFVPQPCREIRRSSCGCSRACIA